MPACSRKSDMALFWLFVIGSIWPGWLTPVLAVALALFVLWVLIDAAGKRRGVAIWALMLAAIVLSGCAGPKPGAPPRKGFFARLGDYLGQFDREYSIQVFNAEGDGVKASAKLSRRKDLK